MVKPSKRTGRPKKGMERGKTRNLTVRMTPTLRAQIDRAAAARGVTRAQDIEERLEKSFYIDDVKALLDKERNKLFEQFGGRKNYAVCKVIATIMVRLSQATGRPWHEDLWTYDQFKRAIDALLARWRWAPSYKTDDAEDWTKPPPGMSYPADLADRLGELTVAHLFNALIDAKYARNSVSDESLMAQDLANLVFDEEDMIPVDSDQEPPGDPRDDFDPIAPEPPSTPKKSSRRRKQP